MRTTYLQGPRLRLTSMAAAKLGQADELAIVQRAESLGVRLGVIYSNGWTISVFRDGSRGSAVVSWHQQKGPLALLLEHILDKYEETLFTPEELVIIANQSGIGVSRA